MVRALTGVLLALVLVAAACSSSGDDDSTSAEGTATPTETPTEAPTEAPTEEPTEAPTEAPTEEPTVAAPPELPDTPVSAPMGEDPTMYYNTGPNEFDPADLGFAPLDVTAKWYKAEGHWVVAFDGLDLAVTGPVCPGASTVVNGTFEFVSNAPSEGADCTGFTTLTDDPDVRALECNGRLSYRTAIPDGSEGNFLFGTVENPTDDGFIIGMTSIADSDPTAPEIDLALLDC
jgi:hypothetical protein